MSLAIGADGTSPTSRACINSSPVRPLLIVDVMAGFHQVTVLERAAPHSCGTSPGPITLTTFHFHRTDLHIQLTVRESDANVSTLHLRECFECPATTMRTVGRSPRRHLRAVSPAAR